VQRQEEVKPGDVFKRGDHLYDVLRVKPVKYLAGTNLVTLKMRGAKHAFDIASYGLGEFTKL
jgi:hypothetical protein